MGGLNDPASLAGRSHRVSRVAIIGRYGVKLLQVRHGMELGSSHPSGGEIQEAIRFMAEVRAY